MKTNSLLTHLMLVNQKKRVKAMKIAFILSFVCAFQVLAFNSEAQNAVITIGKSTNSLEKLFQEIEKQTNYLVVYSNQEVDTKEKFSASNTSGRVSDFLDQAFRGTDVKYLFENDYIVLTKKNVSASALSKQQQRTVSGTVKDKNGEAIIGASVSIVGTATGTATDLDGRFSLPLPENATIIVSYIGYQEKRINVGVQKFINIVLEEESRMLDEVVVVGYGVQKKSNITGAIASIKPAEYKDTGLSATDLLQGRVAGVNVTNGDIIIRGAASINGSGPLWIVDGVPSDAAPNVNDIESFEVLKDAASTAIYGARAAGGVILVTTKKGVAGKVTVNAWVNLGVVMPIDVPEMLGTEDYIKAKLASGYNAPPNAGWDNPSELPNTNWNDMLWRNAFQQNAFIQMTGGSENHTYNTSVELYNSPSIKLNDVQKGGKFRYAGNTKLGKKFSIKQIVTLGYMDKKPSAGGGLGFRQIPTMKDYDPDNIDGGGWGMQPTGYGGGNPLMNQLNTAYNNKYYNGSVNLIFTWKIIEGPALEANLSDNFAANAENQFETGYNIGSLSKPDRLEKNFAVANNMRMFYTLQYDKLFAEKHYFKVLLGYEAAKGTNVTSGGRKYDFTVQPAWNMNLGNGEMMVLGGQSDSRSLSQFGRVNYAYNDKYMFEATVRRDGYDNFGPENRFGVFPSVSAGWNIAKESFIIDRFPRLSQLKLRASWGKTGNNTVPQFLYDPAYTAALNDTHNTHQYYSFGTKGTILNGYRYAGLPNKGIKWEEVTQTDIGIEVGLFRNSLLLTAEYYDKKTTDMLYDMNIPSSAGASVGSYKANIGDIHNRGLDLAIQYRNSYKDFRYDVALTLSTNKNKVVKLNDDINPIIERGGSEAITGSMYRTENGKPMGQMYGYVVEGIFQTKEEIAALNAASPTGLYQVSGTAPGDFKFKDLNHDGKITEEDRQYIGNPWPKLIYGLNINLSWRGFDLVMGWLGHQGVDIYNVSKAVERNFYGDWNTTYKVFDAWTAEHPTEHPRVVTGDPNNNFKTVSSYFVENGSFLKLKSLHFGYNLPKSALAKIGLNGVKIYVNCNNLFAFTKFQGDPEIGGGYLERNCYSDTRWPASKSIVGGLSLTF